jgi:hypothetical protein
MKSRKTNAPEWATAYREMIAISRGRPIRQHELRVLHGFLTVQLKKYARDPAWQAIEASCKRALLLLAGKRVTGKCMDQVTCEDLWTATAADDLPAAMSLPKWKDYLPKHWRRLVPLALSKQGRNWWTPDVEMDCLFLSAWIGATSPGLPPLCFWTDQAAADCLSLASQDPITAECCRIWRRRWKLAKAPFTLIRHLSFSESGHLIVG